MSDNITLTPAADADIRRLDSAVARRIFAKLQWLAENIETIRHEELKAPWQGVFRLRVGDYRVLYTLEASSRRIVAHVVKHRREVYKVRGI